MPNKELLAAAWEILNKMQRLLPIGSGNNSYDLLRTGNWSREAIYNLRLELTPKSMPKSTGLEEDLKLRECVSAAIKSYLAQAGNCGDKANLGLVVSSYLLKRKAENNPEWSATVYSFPNDLDHALLILDDNEGSKIICDPWLHIVWPLDSEANLEEYQKFVVAISIFETKQNIARLSGMLNNQLSDEEKSNIESQLEQIPKSLDTSEERTRLRRILNNQLNEEQKSRLNFQLNRAPKGLGALERAYLRDNAAQSEKETSSLSTLTLFNASRSRKTEISSLMENLIDLWMAQETDAEKRESILGEFAESLREIIPNIAPIKKNLLEASTLSISTQPNSEMCKRYTPQDVISLYDDFFEKYTDLSHTSLSHTRNLDVKVINEQINEQKNKFKHVIAEMEENNFNPVPKQHKHSIAKN